MLDSTDLKIIQFLQENSRMQWKEIGNQVHMTGQAVANRIQRLIDLGIIENFTIKINHQKMGRTVLALVTVFMKTSSNHKDFQQFIQEHEEIIEAHRISGKGCYWLKVSLKDQQQLNHFLDKVLEYGNYQLNMSVEQLK